MIEVIDLLVLGLATFRLALMFSKESGPGRVFQKLRNLPPPKSVAREGLSCPFCMSVWFGMLMSGIYFTCIKYKAVSEMTTQVAHWFVIMLAISAIAVICNQLFTKGDLK